MIVAGAHSLSAARHTQSGTCSFPGALHIKKAAGIISPPLLPSGQRPYWHFGSPSLLAGASAVEPHRKCVVFGVGVCQRFPGHPSTVHAMVGRTTRLVALY